MTILVIEDDPDACDLLTFILGRAGFEVICADDPATALRLLDEQRPALVLLDVNLGAHSGFDVLRELRGRSGVPVIMVTGRNAEDDKVRGLELGADDYVTKPYNNRELVARIRAVLRRQSAAPPTQPPRAPGVLVAGPLRMDVRDYSVTLNGEPVNLTMMEFRLLHYLMTRVGSVVPREELLAHLWEPQNRSPENLRRMIFNLRQKLGDVADPSQLLHTRYGAGIMLRPTEP
jgi:two-component system response regulator RegX3